MAGERAAPRARLPFFDVELAEMPDFYALTGFKRVYDDFDKVVDGKAGFLLRESRKFGHVLNNIGFGEGHDAKYFKG